MIMKIQWIHLDKHLGRGHWKSVEGRFIVTPVNRTGDVATKQEDNVTYDLTDALNRITHRSFKNSGEAREYAFELILKENKTFFSNKIKGLTKQ